MRDCRPALIAHTAIAAGLAWTAAAAPSCHSGCPIKQTRFTTFQGQTAASPTGGTSVAFSNISLSKEIEVDMASTAFGDQTGRVDAFLTTSDCVKLFDGVYAGAAATPLCKTYIGPIAPGTVSGRQTLGQGAYRVFVQAWTSNDSTAKFLIDVDVWGESCSGFPVSP